MPFDLSLRVRSRVARIGDETADRSVNNRQRTNDRRIGRIWGTGHEEHIYRTFRLCAYMK